MNNKRSEGKLLMNRIMRILFNKVNTLKDIEGTNNKKTFIKANEEDKLFIDVLEFLLNENKVTNISKKKIAKKVKVSSSRRLNGLEELFLYLLNECTGTDENISVIQNFIKDYKDFEEDIIGLTTKSTRLGVKKKLVNDALGYELIEDFSIQLGSKVDFDKIPDVDKFITEKMDGIRCFTTIENGKITMKSRQNKEFKGLNEIEDAIKDLRLNNICLDGELLSIGSDNKDVYKDTTKKVMNDDENKTGLKYVLFDIVPIEEFKNKKGKLKYEERRERLNNIQQNEFIQVVPVLYHGKDMDKIMEVLENKRAEGSEGLMINLNKPYEFKRTKNLIKMKVMQTVDLRIIGFEEGDGKFKGTLGKVIVKYKDNEVGVGSGFSDDMRNEIWNNKDKYLDKIIEVQYFEETHDEDGNLSLRFPVFKCVRNDKNEESYN